MSSEKNLKHAIFLLFFFFLQANQVEANSIAHSKNNHANIDRHSNRVVCICIPKCGTHLLMKCISAFSIKGLTYNYNQEIHQTSEKKIRQLNKKLPPYHYKGIYYDILKGKLPKIFTGNLINNKTQRLFFSHCPYIAQFDQFLRHQRTFANFLMIRDPRDMVVSLAFMVHKSSDGKTANIEKILLDLITGKKESYIPWAVEQHEIYPLLWEIGLFKLYKMYLPWIKAKNFTLIKFEDLVGEKGGGSAQKQLQTIIKIGEHLQIKMTPQKALTVIDNLFGGTWTFREGQIGGWKKYFTPEIKKAFKQNTSLMNLLIELGYEQNNNW